MKINFSQLAGTTSPEKPDYWDYFGSRLADHTRIPAEATVLDIGTGSGAVLIPTALAAGFHGKAIGIDIDTDWFRHVIPRLRRLAIGNTALARMDASGLGFADGSFDHVLCGFVGWDYCYDFLKMQFTGPDVRNHTHFERWGICQSQFLGETNGSRVAGGSFSFTFSSVCCGAKQQIRKYLDGL